MDFSKVLVTGGDGALGSYVDFGIRPARADLDVTDRERVFRQFAKHRPTHVLHLAAVTDLERCERDPAYARQVNALGTRHVAEAARKYGAKMVFVSTASVFDCTKEEPHREDDVPKPRNVYGETKAAAEAFVRGLVPNHLIVRSAYMFGGGPEKDKKFVGKILRQLPAAKEILAVRDQISSATYGKDFISKIKEFMREDRTGTLHAVNEGVASKFDLAKEIVKILRLPTRVVPVDAAYFDKSLDRGSFQILASSSGFMRPWREALKDYIHTEWSDVRGIL